VSQQDLTMESECQNCFIVRALDRYAWLCSWERWRALYFVSQICWKSLQQGFAIIQISKPLARFRFWIAVFFCSFALSFPFSRLRASQVIFKLQKNGTLGVWLLTPCILKLLGIQGDKESSNS
jgi:hypothetical protein